MSIDNRGQLAHFITMSEEAHQCRRCIDELNSLSPYLHELEFLDAINIVKDALEKEIADIYRDIKAKKLEYLGPDPLEDALRPYFEEGEE